jgi:hypothetical protein
MARLNPDQLDENEIELVYVAGTLAEAQRVEKALSDAGVDFTIGPEEFRQGLFSHVTDSVHTGAGFFVIKGQAQYCRELVRRAGLRAGVVEADAE